MIPKIRLNTDNIDSTALFMVTVILLFVIPYVQHEFLVFNIIDDISAYEYSHQNLSICHHSSPSMDGKV